MIVSRLHIQINCFTNLLVVLEAGPVEVKDHVHDASVVADDVEVAVVDKGSEAEAHITLSCYKDTLLPITLQTELHILPPVVHEDVDHGHVDIAGVWELKVANVESLPDELALKHENIEIRSLPGGLQVAKVFIVVLGGVSLALLDVVVVVTAHVGQHGVKLGVPAQPGHVAGQKTWKHSDGQ